jgi:predicted phosphodiesterase
LFDSGEVIIGNSLYSSTSILVNGWYFHRVDLTGLNPGETYRYIAGSVDAYSPIYSFKTEGTGNSDFSVLFVTDMHVNGKNSAETWKLVMDSAIQKCPGAAFVVNGGDVAHNNAETGIPFYFDYIQDTIASHAFVYSLGNNDEQNWYNKYFYTPGNGHGGTLYSFDYGNVHFVNIDSNVKLSNMQLIWLDNDLGASGKKWKVAITHEADYGRRARNSDITKLFDKHNVDLVIAGHNHFYGRSKPIDTAGNEKQNGTVWVILNAIGDDFNEISEQPFLAVDEQPNLPMFAEFKFSDTNIILNAYTVDSSGAATLFDTYTVSR